MCTLASYNHAASTLSHRNQITAKAQFNALVAEAGENIININPIARKALTEGLKQLWAMRNRWGLPGAIYIELACDVGNSIEKRRAIKNNLKDKTAWLEHEHGEVCKPMHTVNVDCDTMLRYLLWKEQGSKYYYTR